MRFIISRISKHDLFEIIIIYAFVFFCGFANLATEIIAPRLFSSLFGSTTIIWAIIISVTLIGISIGYYVGGRIRYERIHRIIPILLLINAGWLLAISWIIWGMPTVFKHVTHFSVLITAIVALLPPAVLFSVAAPVAINIMTHKTSSQQPQKVAGNIFALSTVGSVSGALVAAFYLIPWVGLSQSLQLFAFIAVVFSGYFFSKRMRMIALLALIICLFIPQPSFQWSGSRLTLLEQREGYYQTIRVYSKDSSLIVMYLGPTSESSMNLQTHEPWFGYAKTMVKLTGDDVKDKQILIIGGAGHSQARALEKRGARVTEVEIDPMVIALSNKYFGPIQGKVILQDGRTVIQNTKDNEFDFILIDAFTGPASLPPQLTTAEFFQGVSRVLKPRGRMIYNFIGPAAGPNSNAFKALSTTMSSVFADVRASSILNQYKHNIIFVAAQSYMADLKYPTAPKGGVVLTDNHNPIEIFFEQARGGKLYFRR